MGKKLGIVPILFFIFGCPTLWASQSAQDPMIQQGVTSRWSFIERCYQNQVDQGLVGDGKVVAGFKTNEKGRVTISWIESSTLGNQLVERCIMTQFRKLKFEIRNGRPIEGRYPMVFAVTQAKSTPRQHVLSNNEIKQLVDEAVQKTWPKFRKCFVREQISNPKLTSGEIVVQFVVEESGRIAQTSVQKSSLHNENIETCVVQKFDTIRVSGRLAKSIHGIYPITFTVEP
ncbi:MAG: AgmX/PglI C-terminal domain-containing protein [Bdellovibrionales bacterium]|nr:AgmX/PglI C-terminal domain-containing protein [Bdellovibrionales bacterium]